MELWTSIDECLKEYLEAARTEMLNSTKRRRDPEAALSEAFQFLTDHNRKTLGLYLRVLSPCFFLHKYLQNPNIGILASVQVLAMIAINSMRESLCSALPVLSGFRLAASVVEDAILASGCKEEYGHAFALSAALIFQMSLRFHCLLTDAGRRSVPVLSERIDTSELTFRRVHDRNLRYFSSRPPTAGAKAVYYSLEFPQGAFERNVPFGMMIGMMRLVSLFDPRTPRSSVPDKDILRAEIVQLILTKIGNQTAVVPELAAESDVVDAETSISDLYVSRPGVARPRNLRDDIVCEVDRYLSLAPRLFSNDLAAEAIRTPSQWWDTNQYEYPHMHQLAVTLTTIPATTASVESLFSMLRRQRDYTQARMASETLRMRAFVSYNYSIAQRFAEMRRAATNSDFDPLLDLQDLN